MAPALSIDHVVAGVQDLEGTALHLRELGFLSSPRSELQSVGVANRLMLLAPADSACASFFELMQVTDRAVLHPAMAAMLDAPPAWRWLVLATRDAAASHALLAAQGLAMTAPVHVRREWTVAPGESVWPEFDVTFPAPIELPFNLCRYHNVSLYQRPDWMRHPNGATRLLSVWAISTEPRALAHRMARWFGSTASPAAGSDEVWVVAGRPTQLEIWTAPAFARAHGRVPVPAGYAGLRIQARGPRRLFDLAPWINGLIELREEGGA